MSSLKRTANEALGNGKEEDQRHTCVSGDDPRPIGKVLRESSPEASQLSLAGALPKLVVLDLDKTVWPIYCHEETSGPYTRESPESDRDTAVKCRSIYGRPKVVRLYPQVLDILQCLTQQGSIRLAVASRSPVNEGGAARGILGALGLLGLFSCLEIHRGSKAVHFRDIREQTGIEYREMLFFDDEKDNIKTVSRLGVTCVKVSKESGLTFAELNSGLKQYREACLSRSSFRSWFTPVTTNTKDAGTTDQAIEDSRSLVDGTLDSAR